MSDDLQSGVAVDLSDVRDGLGPVARWGRDVADGATLSVIVQRVADGEPLKWVCRSRGWPYSRVAQWIAENEERRGMYEGALLLGADALAQETVGISDGDSDNVPRDALRVKTRQWLASKLDRERYGDRSEVRHSGLVPTLVIEIGGSVPSGRVIEHVGAQMVGEVALSVGRAIDPI